MLFRAWPHRLTGHDNSDQDTGHHGHDDHADREDLELAERGLARLGRPSPREKHQTDDCRHSVLSRLGGPSQEMATQCGDELGPSPLVIPFAHFEIKFEDTRVAAELGGTWCEVDGELRIARIDAGCVFAWNSLCPGRGAAPDDVLVAVDRRVGSAAELEQLLAAPCSLLRLKRHVSDHTALLEAVGVDAQFLSAQGLLDYSLLLGLAHRSDLESTPLSKNCVCSVRLKAEQEDEPNTLYVGIIDIFQTFVAAKVWEYRVKSTIFDNSPVQQPPRYGLRFKAFTRWAEPALREDRQRN